MLRYLLFTLFFTTSQVYAKTYPIQFSISEDKIVKEIPPKNRDFAFILPHRPETYIYEDETSYYKDYQRSYFAITTRKGGWDCMRHYEILANGCIPYFINLENCEEDTMFFLPKDLILEAMHLPGVSFLAIDHSKFDESKYNDILNKLLEHTRKHLSLKNMASYLLNTLHYSGTGPILFLSNDPSPDYLRCGTLAGLKQLLGSRIIDFPKIEHIYKN